MRVKIYDLQKNGIEFKSDFNSFERVLKVIDESNEKSYRKIDLVTDPSNRLFLVKRFADFQTNMGRTDVIEVECFFRKELTDD